MLPAVMPTYDRRNVAFERGEGAYLFATDGRRYLDFASGIAVTGLGHAHPHLVAALKAQAEKEKSLDGVAKALKVSVQHSPALSRQTSDTMFSAPVTAKLFDAGPGGIVSGPQGLSGNYIIARVTGIAHPPLNPNDRNFAGGMAQLSQGVAGDFSIALANAARARQGVKVNQKLVQSVVGGGG